MNKLWDNLSPEKITHPPKRDHLDKRKFQASSFQGRYILVFVGSNCNQSLVIQIPSMYGIFTYMNSGFLWLNHVGKYTINRPMGIRKKGSIIFSSKSPWWFRSSKKPPGWHWTWSQVLQPGHQGACPRSHKSRHENWRPKPCLEDHPRLVTMVIVFVP